MPNVVDAVGQVILLSATCWVQCFSVGFQFDALEFDMGHGLVMLGFSVLIASCMHGT